MARRAPDAEVLPPRAPTRYQFGCSIARAFGARDASAASTPAITGAPIATMPITLHGVGTGWRGLSEIRINAIGIIAAGIARSAASAVIKSAFAPTRRLRTRGLAPTAL